MSFEQLVSLLINKALWFSRGNTLQNMDPYEGQLPEPNLNFSPDDLTKKIFPNLDLGQLDINKFYETHRSFQNNVRVNTLICCWNLHNHESYSMWKVYGKTNNCVAIKTTIGNLKKAFGHYTDYDIFIGQIRYIDFDIQALDESNYLNLFFNKTPFYSSEQEVRFIILDDGDISLFSDEEPYFFSNDSIDPDELSPGVQVPCDTTRLIEEVVIGPDATPWFHSVVKDTLNQFGYINTKTSTSRIKP